MPFYTTSETLQKFGITLGITSVTKENSSRMENQFELKSLGP